jgi:PAS domain S-box-containing protein
LKKTAQKYVINEDHVTQSEDSEYQELLESLVDALDIKEAMLHFKESDVFLSYPESLSRADYADYSEEILSRGDQAKASLEIHRGLKDSTNSFSSQSHLNFFFYNSLDQADGVLSLFGFKDHSLPKKDELLIKSIAQLIVNIRSKSGGIELRGSIPIEFEVFSKGLVDRACVTRTDQKGIITYANTSFCKLTGYSAEELMEKGHALLDSGYHQKSFFDEMLTLVKSGKTWRGEVRNRAKDGRLLWLETTVVPAFDRATGVREFIFFHYDITDKKQAEAFYGEIQRINKVGGWKLDLETQVPTWTDEVFKIHELEIGNIGNVEDAINFYGEDKERFEAIFSDAVEKGIPFEGEFHFVTAKGNKRWVLTNGLPEFNSQGKAIHYYGTIQDITKRKEIELALKESESNTAQIFRQSQDAIMILSGPDWSFSDCNQATLDLFNVDTKENFNLLGPWDLSPKFQPSGLASSEVAKSMIMKALETGSAFFQWDHQTTDAKVFPCTVLLSKIEQNKEVIIHAHVRDISAQKKLERELLASHQYLDFALEGAGLGVWDWYLEDDRVFFDERWTRMLGYELDEVEMDISTWRDNVHPEDLEAAFSDINAYVEGKTESFENLHRMKHKDGRWIYILGRGRFSDWDDEGKPTRFTGTNLDVSDTRDIQGKRLSELNDILSSTPSCLKILDKEGKLIDMNMQGLDLIEADGLSSVVHQSVYDIVEESHREKFIKFNERVCSGESGRLAFEIIGLKGTRRWMESYAAPFKLVNGELGHIAITNDITKKIESEMELEKQKQMAQHKMKLASIGELAAGVGHEINNPLAIVKGYVSVIERKIGKGGSIDASDIDAPMGKINVAINRISKIVKGLRTFSRTDSLEEELFDAVFSVRESVQLVDEIYLKEEIKVTFESSVEIGKTQVHGNQGQFQQVVMNLISNAKDALKENWASKGEKSIHISIDEIFNVLSVNVKDNGKGIPEHLKEKIFDPFFTTKDVNEGTGIGLSLAHSFIANMNGSLEVESEESVGTTFKIAIPCSSVSVIGEED